MDGEIQELRRRLLRAQSRAGESPYVVVRGRYSGVFAGELVDQEASRVTLRNFRRLWYWDGAASISQLARLGTSKPGNCKFTVRVGQGQILDAIEVLEATIEAKASIEAVPEWQA